MRTRDDKTRLSYWFPLIRDAGLPVPKTVIIPALTEKEEGALYDLIGDGTPWPAFEDLCDTIADAGDLVGWPCFLRTDYTSAKHSWREACFLPDRANVGRHVHNIAEFSAMADLMGLPMDRWVVRELLKTEPSFVAFDGMPITREFRVFVKDGAVEHFQPYWPPDAIEGHTSTADWRVRLDALNAIPEDEKTAVVALALSANKAVPGFWSVDCLWVPTRGWFITDMAEGEKSYRWQPTP